MSTSLKLGGLVGDGRLATVHRGTLQGRAVAVKRATRTPGAAAALRREGRVLSAASHQAIVPVLDILDDPLTPALVLGWADGGSLGDLLADGPLSAADLLHLLGPVAGGLHAMHLAGVAHLDVTVENVLLAAVGPVLVDPAPPGSGTPGYADPVVAAGGPSSARSDVFGLAACAHVALTGRLPRPGGGVAVGTGLPGPLTAVLAAGLHPDPRRRPPSPPALFHLLERAVAGRPSPARSRPPPSTATPGRPVARTVGPPAAPARTWPFDRWHTEAAAAERRRAELLAAVGRTASPRPASPRRGASWLVVLVLAVVVAMAALGAGTTRARRPPVRSSAPDSTHRPPAARPPPTATPGGKP